MTKPCWMKFVTTLKNRFFDMDLRLRSRLTTWTAWENRETLSLTFSFFTTKKIAVRNALFDGISLEFVPFHTRCQWPFLHNFLYWYLLWWRGNVQVVSVKIIQGNCRTEMRIVDHYTTDNYETLGVLPKNWQGFDRPTLAQEHFFASCWKFLDLVEWMGFL